MPSLSGLFFWPHFSLSTFKKPSGCHLFSLIRFQGGFDQSGWASCGLSQSIVSCNIFPNRGGRFLDLQSANKPSKLLTGLLKSGAQAKHCLSEVLSMIRRLAGLIIHPLILLMRLKGCVSFFPVFVKPKLQCTPCVGWRRQESQIQWGQDLLLSPPCLCDSWWLGGSGACRGDVWPYRGPKATGLILSQ